MWAICALWAASALAVETPDPVIWGTAGVSFADGSPGLSIALGVGAAIELDTVDPFWMVTPELGVAYRYIPSGSADQVIGLDVLAGARVDTVVWHSKAKKGKKKKSLVGRTKFAQLADVGALAHGGVHGTTGTDFGQMAGYFDVRPMAELGIYGNYVTKTYTVGVNITETVLFPISGAQLMPITTVGLQVTVPFGTDVLGAIGKNLSTSLGR